MPSSLDLTLGAVEMGAMMSMMLYGTVTVQMYMYAMGCKTDRVWLKVLVAFVWCLETLHITAMLAYVYYLTVARYADETAIGEIKWFTVVSVILSSLVGTPVQIYFTYRAWIVSGRSWFATLPWIAETLRCGVIMTSCINLSRSSTLQEFRAQHGWLITMTLISCVLVDMYNSVVLCYHLRRHRVSFEPTINFVNAIILWSVETSLIVCAFATFAIVFWLAFPNTLLWLSVNVIHAKIYSNSMMLSLNARIVRKAQHARPAALPQLWEVLREDSSVPSSARSPPSTMDLYTPDCPPYALVHRDIKLATGSPTSTFGNYPISPPARAELARFHV